jgi:hypothetical protein
MWVHLFTLPRTSMANSLLIHFPWTRPSRSTLHLLFSLTLYVCSFSLSPAFYKTNKPLAQHPIKQPFLLPKAHLFTPQIHPPPFQTATLSTTKSSNMEPGNHFFSLSLSKSQANATSQNARTPQEKGAHGIRSNVLLRDRQAHPQQGRH